jgi:hypothetical protein
VEVTAAPAETTAAPAAEMNGGYGRPGGDYGGPGGGDEGGGYGGGGSVGTSYTPPDVNGFLPPAGGGGITPTPPAGGGGITPTPPCCVVVKTPEPCSLWIFLAGLSMLLFVLRGTNKGSVVHKGGLLDDIPAYRPKPPTFR